MTQLKHRETIQEAIKEYLKRHEEDIKKDTFFWDSETSLQRTQRSQKLLLLRFAFFANFAVI